MHSSVLQNWQKVNIPSKLLPKTFDSVTPAGTQLQRIIESDFDMRPITEGLLLGGSTSAESIWSLSGRFFALRVNQNADASHKQWTILYNLDLCGGLFCILDSNPAFLYVRAPEGHRSMTVMISSELAPCMFIQGLLSWLNTLGRPFTHSLACTHFSGFH